MGMGIRGYSSPLIVKALVRGASISTVIADTGGKDALVIVVSGPAAGSSVAQFLLLQAGAVEEGVLGLLGRSVGLGGQLAVNGFLVAGCHVSDGALSSVGHGVYVKVDVEVTGGVGAVQAPEVKSPSSGWAASFLVLKGIGHRQELGAGGSEGGGVVSVNKGLGIEHGVAINLGVAEILLIGIRAKGVFSALLSVFVGVVLLDLLGVTNTGIDVLVLLGFLVDHVVVGQKAVGLELRVGSVVDLAALVLAVVADSGGTE